MASKTNDASVRAGETLPLDIDAPDSVVKTGYRIRDVLTYSSAYLVFIAMIEVLTVHVVLSVPLNPAPLVVGLVAFSVYVGDRIADAETDELATPERSAFVTRYRTPLSVATALAYGIAVALAITGGPAALAITLMPGAFWILYASDWLPAVGIHFDRLKQVLVVNSALVALAWAIAVVGLPLAFADASVTPLAAVLFVYFFVDTFVNTEIPNVRDVEADAAIGVSTLPVAFGVDRTRHVLYGIDLALIGFVAVAFATGVVATAVAAAILVGLAYALGVAAFVGRTTAFGRLEAASKLKHLVVLVLVLVFVTLGI